MYVPPCYMSRIWFSSLLLFRAGMIFAFAACRGEERERGKERKRKSCETTRKIAIPLQFIRMHVFVFNVLRLASGKYLYMHGNEFRSSTKDRNTVYPRGMNPRLQLLPLPGMHNVDLWNDNCIHGILRYCQHELTAAVVIVLEVHPWPRLRWSNHWSCQEEQINGFPLPWGPINRNVFPKSQNEKIANDESFKISSFTCSSCFTLRKERSTFYWRNHLRENDREREKSWNGAGKSLRLSFFRS